MKNNVVNKNLSIKQCNEILTLLNRYHILNNDDNRKNRIRYWFNGRIVLIKTEAFNK